MTSLISQGPFSCMLPFRSVHQTVSTEELKKSGCFVGQQSRIIPTFAGLLTPLLTIFHYHVNFPLDEILAVGNVRADGVSSPWDTDKNKAEYFDVESQQWKTVPDYPFNVTESNFYLVYVVDTKTLSL